MLTKIFGDYPQVRVIDLLISHPWSEYSKSDIAEYSNISRPTLYRFFEALLKYELIKPTRKFGNTQLYQVNMESQTVKAINQFQMHLSKMEFSYQLSLEDKKDDAEVVRKVDKTTNKFIDTSSFVEKIENVITVLKPPEIILSGSNAPNVSISQYPTKFSAQNTSLPKPVKIDTKLTSEKSKLFSIDGSQFKKVAV